MGTYTWRDDWGQKYAAPAPSLQSCLDPYREKTDAYTTA